MKSSAPSIELRLDRHCLPLDGVRGIAVLLVLCYDCLKLAPSADGLTFAARRLAASGWVGVDLFFVLSGFLITGVLLETRGLPGYWKSFFLRRSVRIFPLYYATLFTVFCLVPLGLWLERAPESVIAPFDAVRKDQLWYWLYAQNWLFAWRQAWPDGVPIKHFWSLAIEEQFYLVWPLVVAWTTRRQLAWVCVSLSVLALSTRVCLLTHGTPPMVVFVMTITRLDGLCMGALLAIALRNVRLQPLAIRWLPGLAVGAMAGLACLDLVWPVLRSESFAAYSFGHLFTAMAFAALVGGAQCAPQQHVLARVLSWSFLGMLGKYSYAIYVFHKFVYLGVMQFDWSAIPESMRGWGIFGCTLALSLLAAQISWVLLERPCLSLKKYFPRPDAPEPDAQTSNRGNQTEVTERSRVLI
ncbi:acyltransferase family protein [Planctomicrobium sp. SH661]|uniref:acyltransferase family protein n=1 Tax=Planctomicrobium sp. SH661 TaxID=3448124 RepID=UPI003F5BAF97